MRPGRTPRLTANGTVDIVLAALLAVLSIAMGFVAGAPAGIALDLVACALAALTVRWPRAAGVALGVVLALYLVAPTTWGLMGEYAPLIPVLGAGMRGQHRQRTLMAVGYWLVLTCVQVRDYGVSARTVLASLLWASLFAVMWLIGSVFTAYLSAQARARAAAMAQQRLNLARDLHDSLARTLVHLSLHARRAAAAGDTGALAELADGLTLASGELRWLLSALRDPDEQPAIAAGGSLAITLQQVMDDLSAHDHPLTVTIDGDIAGVPARIGDVVARVALEAAANIDRHAAKGRPCTLVASVADGAVDLAFINEVAPGAPSPGSGTQAMGLVGASERLAAVGGMLETRTEGRQWITRITVPMLAEA